MLPDNEHVIGHRREDLGTQIPKPSVTQNDNPVGRGDLELRRNLKRGGNRLGEHGDIVGYRVRHPMEIALRHGDQLGKRAVMVEDAEDGTVGAVGRQAAAAGLTAPAGAIDLAADPLAGIRAGFRDPDELVAEHPAEAHVALNQLEVGLADAGTSYPDQHFVRGRGWRGPNLVHLNFVSFKNDCAHLSASFVRNRCGLVPVFCTPKVAWFANHFGRAQVQCMVHRPFILAGFLAAAGLVLLSHPVFAQGQVRSANEPNRTHKDGKVVRALRITGTAPSIDGRLSDETWQLAEVGGGLTQRDPDNGTPMTDDTRVQIAFDDRYIYVAVSALDSDAKQIAAGLARRDENPPTDYVTIGFDARHDHQTAYNFSTNPSGWQGDFTFYDDTNRDNDYNAVWDVRSEITDTGWTAEFRIPFSQMRFSASPVPGQVWGFNIQRQIRRKSENGTWVPKPRGERGEVSFFGHLVFEQQLPAPGRLELIPYTLARGEFLPARVNEGGASAGLDARWGPGTGATR